MMPDRTSPDPPVPNPGLPVVLTSTLPASSLTMAGRIGNDRRSALQKQDDTVPPGIATGNLNRVGRYLFDRPPGQPRHLPGVGG